LRDLKGTVPSVAPDSQIRASATLLLLIFGNSSYAVGVSSNETLNMKFRGSR